MGVQELYKDDDSMNAPFQRMFNVVDQSRNIIKVIGVGGGGSNAIKTMIEQGFTNVTFAVVNTDSQALQRSTVPNKIPLGNTGLGVGGKPEKGREAAEYSIESIKALLSDNTKMVLIAAGMGGGTGTGASPVIARVAREMGILTIGVVTLPFAFEKQKRIDQALQGVKTLKENVDSLLVINNQRLLEIYQNEDMTVDEAFNKADEIITTATRSITEIITEEGKINRDFCDVQTVMQNGGAAIMASGKGHGDHRVIRAIKEALDSPLLNKSEIEKSKKLLYIIYQSHSNPLTINELNETNEFMDEMGTNLEVLWGLYWDDSIGENVKVDLIATGFDKEPEETNEDINDNKIVEMYDHYYGPQKKQVSMSAKLEAKINPNVVNLPVDTPMEDLESTTETEADMNIDITDNIPDNNIQEGVPDTESACIINDITTEEEAVDAYTEAVPIVKNSPVNRFKAMLRWVCDYLEE